MNLNWQIPITKSSSEIN